MNSSVFALNKFNLIEDDSNYYVFRALNKADHNDIHNNITSTNNIIKRIRTDRERFEETNGKAKYNSQSRISLEEVWDHIKIRYLKETNCISLTSNTNVSLDYGQEYNQEYAMIKVPKKGSANIYYAGQYMLEEINKSIESTIKQLQPNSNLIETINKIDNEISYKNVRTIITDIYDGIKKVSGKFAGKNNNIKSKESIVSRFNKKQYFSDEQQLEYSKIVAKLTALEAHGYLKSIIPNKNDNSSLLATIGVAFSSGELIHYKDILAEDIVTVDKSMMDILSYVQQLKEQGINNEPIKKFEKKIIDLINEGYKLEVEEQPQEFEKELSIEEAYTATKGKISYEKAKISVEFIKKLSQSRIRAINDSNIVKELEDGNEEISNLIARKCFRINRDIISRENNIGVKIAETVNIGLTAEQRRIVSNREQVRIIEKIQNSDLEQLTQLSNIQKLSEKNDILEELLETDEEMSENQYFAEAIVDGIDFAKIYKMVVEEKRTISKEERDILISKLKDVDCKRLYNAFKNIGANSNEISGFITNILLNKGYKGYSIEELSRLDNLDDIIKVNVKNNNLRNNVSALKLDSILGIEDDSYRVSDTGIKLRDYQYEAFQHINQRFENKRFVGMILPTGAGKSFVAMSAMMNFKNVDSNKEGANSNILFIAPQHAILHQFQIHILKNILNKKIITEEEIEELKAEGKTIPKNVIQQKDFTRVLKEEFPTLKMFCYATLAENGDEWLEAKDADLIIFDELHRAGAKTWEPQIRKLLELNPKAKVLGMTATPVRDVDGKDMARALAEITGDYTEEEIIHKEYLASEMHLLDAMQENYVVKPKIVTFDYSLQESDEYKEVERMISGEKDSKKQKELVKVKSKMDSIIKTSEKKGINGILEQNIKKKSGKYIVFLPQNPNNDLSSEEYMKKEIEKVKEYFKNVNPNIKTSYLLSNRESAKIQNAKALDDFENDNSNSLKLLFAVDMLNEGVHVDGIDGAVMMRPISENSKILYLQQIGRCIFSENPEKPTPDEDRPIIFDVYNNYLAHNMHREANRSNPTSDLQKLMAVIAWIEKHKGYIPDINSEEIKEAKKAVTLKNIQKKYKKYLTEFDKGNLSQSEIYEINKIISLGQTIELWDLEIPDRIIPPGEKDIARNDVFKVEGTQKEFIDLFKKAKEITKDSVLKPELRIKEFINLVDILNEYGVEISNRTILSSNTLNTILNKLPKNVKKDILDSISEMNTVIDKNFKIGKEYNFVKESFYQGNKVFLEYDVRDLRKYGIFEEFICTKGKKNKDKVMSALQHSDEKTTGFIVNGPAEFKEININTGTRFDEEGYDIDKRDRYGIRRGESFNKYYFGRNGHYYKLDNGRFIDTGSFENPYGFRIDGTYKNTGQLEDCYGFKIDGTWKNTGAERDDKGFDINGVNKCNFGRNGNYYKKDKEGNWQDTGKQINPQHLDKNGDYWLVDKEGNPIENTHRKFDKNGFSLYGINKYGISKETGLWHGIDLETGKPLNKEGSIRNPEGFGKEGINYAGFDREGYYYEERMGGLRQNTGKKINKENFDINGDYWIVDEEGNPVENTHQKFDKNGYNCYGLDQYGFKQSDQLWHGIDMETGEKMFEQGRERDPKGFDINGINQYNFGRNENYYEKDEEGKWQDTGKKINPEHLDINGDYWLVDKEGNPLENTHSKFGKNGYNLLGLNKYNFDRNGYYYQRSDKTGVLVNTGNTCNRYGFTANGRHCSTKTYTDIRGFDIEGRCRANNNSIYDKNGFKQDGTYMETGQNYYEGYNAFGVNTFGENREGKIDPTVRFGIEYVDAVMKNKRQDFLKKYKVDRTNYKEMMPKIEKIIYKAQEMYPTLKNKVADEIQKTIRQINEREKNIKPLLNSPHAWDKAKLEKLKRENDILRNKIKYMNPMLDIEK